MPAFHFIHPGDLSTRTGGYGYARSLLRALSRRGIAATLHRLADSFPFPDDAALSRAAQVLASIADGSLVVVDGLALGAMPAQAAAHAQRLRLVALVHHPLALESGLSAADAARLRASEREALACVRAVVVTSPATAGALQDFGVPASRITVVVPGTERPRSGPSGAAVPAGTASPGESDGEREGAVRLLCVASVTPRKGHLDLIEALSLCSARNPALAWRLLCVGSVDRDPACARALRERIRALGLDNLASLAGERDEAGVERAYAESDVFVLASHHEGYGMVLAEAMAWGLPIVSTTAGAIPGTVPSGAGLLVAPGDIEALARALAQVIGERGVREAMAAEALRAAAWLPDWDAAAQRFIGLLQSLGVADLPQSSRNVRLPHLPDVTPAAVQPDPLTFSSGWLALREPHDHAARAEELTLRLCRFLRPSSEGPAVRTIRVLDLACGAGSSFRYLAPRIGGSQHWRMVDRDPVLLARLPATGAVTGAAPASGALAGAGHAVIEPLCLDLASDLSRLPLQAVDLITASALLDLVSGEWLDRLVAAAVAAGVAVAGDLPAAGTAPALLLTLTYDGSVDWAPALPDDAWTIDLFNRHQRGDKGFGPALGPDAAAEATRRLQSAGFTVMQAASPWRLGVGDGAIQREFMAGIGGAGAAMLGSGSARLQAWLAQRTAFIDQGRSSVTVGHHDLLALPARLPGR